MDSSLDRSLSALSISSANSQPEDDWDRSLILDPQDTVRVLSTTPRNSVAFPCDGTPGRSSQYSSAHDGPCDARACAHRGQRTLSELLRLHSEKGTNGSVTPEEAARIADVLGQWINASSSPYEGEDDFFSRSQDDSCLSHKRPLPLPLSLVGGRPRGRSESTNSISALAAQANTPSPRASNASPSS